MTQDQVDRLTKAFRDKFDATVEAEPINDRGRFRFAVVSPSFHAMTHLQRQDALWQIADETLPREVTLDISLILAFAPDELAATG